MAGTLGFSGTDDLGFYSVKVRQKEGHVADRKDRHVYLQLTDKN